jgi:hypothetical protein
MGITASSASHMAVDLNTGLSVERTDTANFLIACVHPAG